jgi:hypothetical protein
VQNGILECYKDDPDPKLLDQINERFEFMWGYITKFNMIILRDSMAVQDIYEKHFTLVHFSKYPDGTYLLVPDHPKLNLVEMVKEVLALLNDPNYWAEILHDDEVLRVTQTGTIDEHAGN